MNILVEEKWILFLKQFSNKQFDFSFFKDEKGRENYTIEQVLSLEVIVSNRYGFLSLKFKNHGLREKFLQNINITQEIQEFENSTRVNTIWLTEEFPCRVYFSGTKLILSFYDSDELMLDNQVFENRIKVFQNVLIALLKLSILKNTEIS